jgi:hypothetical protein
VAHKNHRTLEASVNAYRKTHQQTPKAKPKKPEPKPQKPKPNRYQPKGKYLKDAANVSLPIPDLTLKEQGRLDAHKRGADRFAESATRRGRGRYRLSRGDARGNPSR